MKPRSRPPATPAVLSESLHRQLHLYALAASAAGVSILALARASEAKIIYTKTHKVIGRDGVYPLDLNHDGVVDFLILQATSGYQPSNALFAKEAAGNAVLGYTGFVSWVNFASALKRGAWIGPPTNPRQRFVDGGYLGEGMASFYATDEGFRSAGPWLGNKHGYLGLKFQIRGETHYGWARLHVRADPRSIIATLTEYAYETVANKGIGAGQTRNQNGESQSPAVSTNATTLRAASLGTLALGAQNGGRSR
jgi:hypothetical protein